MSTKGNVLTVSDKLNVIQNRKNDVSAWKLVEMYNGWWTQIDDILKNKYGF